MCQAPILNGKLLSAMLQRFMDSSKDVGEEQILEPGFETRRIGEHYVVWTPKYTGLSYRSPPFHMYFPFGSML
jgi:hypothetical protein